MYQEDRNVLHKGMHMALSHISQQTALIQVRLSHLQQAPLQAWKSASKLGKLGREYVSGRVKMRRRVTPSCRKVPSIHCRTETLGASSHQFQEVPLPKADMQGSCKQADVMPQNHDAVSAWILGCHREGCFQQRPPDGHSRVRKRYFPRIDPGLETVQEEATCSDTGAVAQAEVEAAQTGSRVFTAKVSSHAQNLKQGALKAMPSHPNCSQSQVLGPCNDTLLSPKPERAGRQPCAGCSQQSPIKREQPAFSGRDLRPLRNTPTLSAAANQHCVAKQLRSHGGAQGGTTTPPAAAIHGSFASGSFVFTAQRPNSPQQGVAILKRSTSLKRTLGANY
jgi:hypothetical protein